MDPPISVPKPTIEPLKAMRAPSPPEEPPQDSLLLCGLTVRLGYERDAELNKLPSDVVYCFSTHQALWDRCFNNPSAELEEGVP